MNALRLATQGLRPGIRALSIATQGFQPLQDTLPISAGPARKRQDRRPREDDELMLLAFAAAVATNWR